MPESSTHTVLALVNDLMFASKVRGTGSAVGVPTRTLNSAEALLEACKAEVPRLILIDVEARSVDVPALIERLKSDGRTASVPVVGYASHVNREAIGAARTAGADRVLARSAFVRELPTMLRDAPASEASSSEASEDGPAEE